MRAALLAAFVLITACSSGSVGSAATLSPSTGPPAPGGFGIACRLPISWSPTNATPDPTNSGVGIFDAATGAVTTTAALPALHYLTGGPGYDAALGKWMPVPAGAIAPDGLHYAYAEWDPPASGLVGGVHVANTPTIGTKGRVHIVDATSGADTVVYSGEPTYQVVGFVAAGILLSKFTASMAGIGEVGLYLLKPTAGSTPQFLPHSDVQLEAGGWGLLDGDTAAWGTTFSNGIGGLGPGNELIRFDLSTLAAEPWLTLPLDHDVILLGFADHDPVVLTSNSALTQDGPTDARVLRLTAPNQSRQLFADDAFSDPLPGHVVAGSTGLWFGGLGTLWLYDGTSMRHVSVLTPDAGVDVGGGCLR